MALVPRFINSDFGGPVAVTTAANTRTGGASTGTEIIATEPGANGGVFKGAVVHVSVGVATQTAINFWHHDASAATYNLIGNLIINGEISASAHTQSAFVGTFIPVGGDVLLNSTDNIKAAPMSGSCTFDIRPLGGNF